jgi:hypothetical protein
VCPPGVLRGEELGFWLFGLTVPEVFGSGQVEDLVDFVCGRGDHRPIPLMCLVTRSDVGFAGYVHLASGVERKRKAAGRIPTAFGE